MQIIKLLNCIFKKNFKPANLDEAKSQVFSLDYCGIANDVVALIPRPVDQYNNDPKFSFLYIPTRKDQLKIKFLSFFKNFSSTFKQSEIIQDFQLKQKKLNKIEIQI